MPTPITFGAAAIKSYGFSLGSKYFMSLISSTANLYLSSFGVNPTNKKIQAIPISLGSPILNLNPNGVLSSTNVSGYTGLNLSCLVTGSNGYTYIAAYDTSYSPYLITLDTTGAFYSLIKFSSSISQYDGYYAQNMVVDSSGNVFIFLESDRTPIYSGILIKINPISAPTTVYKYNNPDFTDYFSAWNSSINSSGKIIFGSTLQNYIVTPPFDAQTATVNIVDPVSGGTSKKVFIGGTTVDYYPTMISTAIDSSDNIYFYAAIKYGTALKYILCKANSTLTSITWTLDLDGASFNSVGGQLAVDASNNIYLYTGNSSSRVVYITKINSSGAVQYYRQITTSASGGLDITGPNAIKVIGSDLYIASVMPGVTPQKSILLKVPTDGSRTATFSLGGYTMSYANSSQTITTTTAPSLSSSTVTTSLIAYTNTTPSYTNTSYTASSAVHSL